MLPKLKLEIAVTGTAGHHASVLLAHSFKPIRKNPIQHFRIDRHERIRGVVGVEWHQIRSGGVENHEVAVGADSGFVAGGAVTVGEGLRSAEPVKRATTRRPVQKSLLTDLAAHAALAHDVADIGNARVLAIGRPRGQRHVAGGAVLPVAYEDPAI